ncbi:single-stranded-DNA-specific exonuclease RecJ [Aneurinibacillus terranovensis]|uniref:single-stranded-DNA-specific exonuclease RecJ n=1 Tax=Aneurinibacillus terranovensis TaxID=278991 RepID=UPI00041B230C|nr:single-stranded-DNA-specific exonuclease RecJ [Aneurinibacillus terranovensis]
MLQSKTRWQIEDIDDRSVEELQHQLHISPLVARLLVGRGLDTAAKAEKFLRGGISDFYDPFLLDGMEKAITRTKEAIETGEPILIYGDYDADGVTSTSIMVHTMRQAGASFQYYIPNRFTEGYGLNKEALARAADKGFSLVITVDTGISAIHEVEKGKEWGLDIIITDHHEPPSQIPDAYAVINPKKPGCTYPFDMLAGAGVAFKFAHALLGEFPHHLLDIAAIGTIADLVPLVDENRLLAKHGLQAIDRTANPGIKALKKVCGIDGRATAYHIGFGMGPRINATGRLETADRAVKLLVTNKEEEAEEYARELDELNTERQALVQKIAAEAEELVLAMPEDETNVLVVAKEGWNEGVIGIVASRLVEKFYRPAIVLSISEDGTKAKGSARSIAGFNIYEALTTCRDILPHFGGHTMAAGMSLALEHVNDLRWRLNNIAREWLTPEDYIPVTRVDAVCTLEDATLQTVDELEQLAPFGMGNPSPRILIEKVELGDIRTIGQEQTHLKCQLRQGEHILDGIGFKLAEVVPNLSSSAEANIVGELHVNEWNNNRRAQFTIKDIAIPGLQVFDWRGARNKEERLAQLDADETVHILVFRRKNHQSLLMSRQNRGGFEVMAAPIEADVSHVRRLVLYDLPHSLQNLHDYLSPYTGVERIYCLFGEEPGSLSSLPTRDHFKEVYKGIIRSKKVRTQDIPLLAKATLLTPSSVSFILDVFHDLGFLHKLDGVYTLVENPMKKDLTESIIYQEKRKALELETELLYSPPSSLSHFIKQCCHHPTAEEEIVHGF